MKSKKFICLMAALIMTMTAAGCNDSGELFTVSTEPSNVSKDDTWTNADNNGELVPKINAVKRPENERNSFSDTYDAFFGAVADGAKKEAATTATDGITAFAGDYDIAAEAPAAEAPATIADTAPAPGYEDVYGIVDDEFYDYEYKQPQPGLLTAGIWNDNNNWGFFTNLVNNDKITIPSQYGLNPTNRIAVTVKTKDSLPVVNAAVRGFYEKGNLVWSAVTDKNGVAYLFKGDQISSIEVESQGQTQKQSVTPKKSTNDQQTNIKVQNNDITVIFEGDSKNYEKTEIMFVVDTTGSMGDELSFLQSEFTAIANEVGTDNTRFSINFYRDEYDDYTTKRYPFSSNIEEINKKLNSEYASGGGDLPEAVAEILDETINDGGWTDESVKLMFMIFDAPPHDNKSQILESAIEKAAEKGIRIIPVVSSNSDRDTELFGRCAAIMTGGTYIFLTDDSGIGSSHLEPIIGEYKVEKLYDIIIRTINEYKQGEIKTPSEPSEQSSETSQEINVSEIIDRTVTEQISTDAALEKFFEDDENEYYYGSIKSEYVIVKYSDGSQETVSSALQNGKITLSDLDKYNIGYIKQPKIKTLPGNVETGTFSFNDENMKYAKTDGFVNTAEGDMTDVVSRAKTEVDKPYDVVEVFYDDETDMWKVYFFVKDILGGGTIVYLDGNGITKAVIDEPLFLT